MSFNSFDYSNNPSTLEKGLNITTNSQIYNDKNSLSTGNIYDQSQLFGSSYHPNFDELNIQGAASPNTSNSPNNVFVNSNPGQASNQSVSFTSDGAGFFLDSNPFETTTNDNNNSSNADVVSDIGNFFNNLIKFLDWGDNNLKDKELISITANRAADGELTRKDMIDIFKNAQDGGIIDANELTDLRTIVSNDDLFGMQDYVTNLSSKVVNGNVANKNYQGESLGNLYAGSSSDHIEKLVNKWFFGGDRPVTDIDYTYQKAEGSLFQDGITYQDIKQGDVGNCYFMAGLGEIAFRSPETIENMFIDNGDDTYTVRFYQNGTADYVTVDKELPVNSLGNLVYANRGASYKSEDTELWTALAEKAYAQLNESEWIRPYDNNETYKNTNSYKGIEYGFDNYVVNQVTGLKSNYSSYFDFDSMVNAFENDSMMGISSKKYGVASNVVANHVYVVVDYNAATEKFTLYNPWGSENATDRAGNLKPLKLNLSLEELEESFEGWSYT